MIIDTKEVKDAVQLQLDLKDDWWITAEYNNFSKSIRGITGVTFLVLGLSILNYGTKLEATVSSALAK